MDKLTELKEIKANVEIIDKKYRESKGYGESTDKPCAAETEDMMYSMVQGIYRYIDYIEGNIYSWQDRHIENSTHLPKLTPSQTEKLLKAAGASEDFDVQKKIIWSSTTRAGNKEFEIDLNIK